ncbi:MAG TPA: Holliday junction branch migration protein RuvA [Candidatus Paceibacterota bacterium]|nr:Holliday junction branch migration protein RuvA [Candidatus Paceibacterota bacterium]
MIARISGIVVEQSEKGVVIETGGLGYFIYTPVVATLDEPLTLHTHLIVRDDTHELYGFATPEERVLFTTLLSVSGVGPKSALAMLSLYTLPVLVRHIKRGDAKAISLVPGIGKKTAEKICIDLKDKVQVFETLETETSSDLVEALLSLGYKEVHIRTVITSVDGTLPIEQQITLALQLLKK